MNRPKYKGLIAELIPNIRIMQYTGMFIFNYYDEYTAAIHGIRVLYAILHFSLILVQFIFLIIHMGTGQNGMYDYMSADTITVLFFTHSVVKYVYFAVNTKSFYRILAIWNKCDHHPLFMESNNRFRASALKKMRQLLYIISFLTILSIVCWVSITFFSDNSRQYQNPENKNETIVVTIPRLPVATYYPWEHNSGIVYYVTFAIQTYWIIISLIHENSMDVMFCSWLIFASEQLKHLKEILHPLMQLSSSLDTYVPNSANLFQKSEQKNIDLKGVFNTRIELGEEYRKQEYEIQTSEGIGPNHLSKKQELIVRSAIKYWVERHKHAVRLVDAIGDTYGLALLLHMLISTILLTLLAFQATKVNGINAPSLATIGYLLYALGQVYHFCLFGNQLIEESSSILDSAYNSRWYNGSEEAKTFIQIVCQQTQRSLSISGAKFFTVSLDLFASVLGAVVTYFMVLIQLN